VKLVVGLGNPGAEYDRTRHNVGWWVVDRLAYDWDFGSFAREGPALVSAGTVSGAQVRLAKPTTYMNRSGAAVAGVARDEHVDTRRDLLVVVDDASLDIGRVRFRPGGSAGGHNGLKSIEGVLGHREYARLRIGVGRPPEGADLVEWVLSPMPDEDEDVVLERVAELTKGVETWIEHGVQDAMNRYNR